MKDVTLSKEDEEEFLVDYAYNSVLAAIVNNQIKPGSMISEGDISKKLGISRTPTREAFKRLESEGLIEIIPRKGAFVTELNVETIVEIYHVREALECYAIELVPLYGERLDLERLIAEIESSDSLIEKGEYNTLHEIDARFHQYIIDATKNETLSKLVRRFMIPSLRLRHTAPSTIERLREIQTEQKEVVYALRDNEIETAKKALVVHLRNSCTNVVKARLRMR